MRRLWLIFAQAVTVAVAVLFVLATLKPDWVRGRGPLPTVAVFEAPAAASQPLPGAASLRAAAAAALPAVVSVTAYARRTRQGLEDDPAFRFFHGDRLPRGGGRFGQGSGVIVSPQGYLLTNHHVIAGATEDVRDTLRGHLAIGLHRDVQVTEVDGDERRLVSQAFCSPAGGIP